MVHVAAAAANGIGGIKVVGRIGDAAFMMREVGFWVVWFVEGVGHVSGEEVLGWNWKDWVVRDEKRGRKEGDVDTSALNVPDVAEGGLPDAVVG